MIAIITPRGGGGGDSLTVASDGDMIYVAETVKRRIQVLNVTSTDDIHVIRVTADDPSVLYKPVGIAVDRASGYIFVTGFRGSNGGSWVEIIITYNMTGHYVRHVTASDLGVDQTDLRQSHIALYRDQVYVSDIYNECIYIVIYWVLYIEARSLWYMSWLLPASIAGGGGAVIGGSYRGGGAVIGGGGNVQLGVIS